MPKLPCISPEKLGRVLEKCGFGLERIRGSHHFYHNPETKKSTSVPFHDKDVPKGHLCQIRYDTVHSSWVIVVRAVVEKKMVSNT